MSVQLSPTPILQFTDDNGVPLEGGKLYFFDAGTTTPATVYKDKDQTTPHPSPIVLNARGETPDPVFLVLGESYDIRLDDPDDVTIYTVDNVPFSEGGEWRINANGNLTTDENVEIETNLFVTYTISDPQHATSKKYVDDEDDALQNNIDNLDSELTDAQNDINSLEEYVESQLVDVEIGGSNDYKVYIKTLPLLISRQSAQESQSRWTYTTNHGLSLDWTNGQDIVLNHQLRYIGIFDSISKSDLSLSDNSYIGDFPSEDATTADYFYDSGTLNWLSIKGGSSNQFHTTGSNAPYIHYGAGSSIGDSTQNWYMVDPEYELKIKFTPDSVIATWFVDSGFVFDGHRGGPGGGGGNNFFPFICTDNYAETADVGQDNAIALFFLTVVYARKVSAGGPDSGDEPVASIDYTFDGAEYSFDGTSSVASSGESITDYVWDFGDGSGGTGSTITHTYSEDGEYVVELEVTDSGGNVDTDQTTITVDSGGGTGSGDTGGGGDTGDLDPQ